MLYRYYKQLCDILTKMYYDFLKAFNSHEDPHIYKPIPEEEEEEEDNRFFFINMEDGL